MPEITRTRCTHVGLRTHAASADPGGPRSAGRPAECSELDHGRLTGPPAIGDRHTVHYAPRCCSVGDGSSRPSSDDCKVTPTPDGFPANRHGRTGRVSRVCRRTEPGHRRVSNSAWRQDQLKRRRLRSSAMYRPSLSPLSCGRPSSPVHRRTVQFGRTPTRAGNVSNRGTSYLPLRPPWAPPAIRSIALDVPDGQFITKHRR